MYIVEGINTTVESSHEAEDLGPKLQPSPTSSPNQDAKMNDSLSTLRFVTLTAPRLNEGGTFVTWTVVWSSARSRVCPLVSLHRECIGVGNIPDHVERGREVVDGFFTPRAAERGEENGVSVAVGNMRQSVTVFEEIRKCLHRKEYP